jgi:hemerythrin
MSDQIAEVTASAQGLAEMARTMQGLIARFQMAQDRAGEPASGRPATGWAAVPALVRPVPVNGNNTPRPNGHGLAAQALAAPLTAAGRMYAWDETLASGDAKVDQQHRELLKQINLLLQSMTQGRGRNEIEPILDFLGAYVEQHFTWEESCMEKHRCPVAAVNKQAHRRFVEKFRGLRDRFYRDGPTAELVLAVKEEMGDWLVNHIRKIDTGLKPCVARHSRPDSEITR